jgi:hypothetical protein
VAINSQVMEKGNPFLRLVNQMGLSVDKNDQKSRFVRVTTCKTMTILIITRKTSINGGLRLVLVTWKKVF